MKRGRKDSKLALVIPPALQHVAARVLCHTLLLAVIFLAIPQADAALVEETGTMRGFLAGSCPTASYDNWISHTTEGIADPGYNHYGPEGLDRQMEGFGDVWVLPNNLTGRAYMAHWQTIFSAFLEGRLADADVLLSDSAEVYRYEVVLFHDTEYGRDYGILRELLDDSYVDNAGTPADASDDVTGGFQNGWGVYVVNLDSPRPYFLVQMVHPNDDFLGVQAAVEVFLRCDAGALSIWGCGREVVWTEEGSYANSKSLSDPSRYPVSVTMAFQNAFDGKYALTYPPGTMIMQCHSFDTTHTTPKDIVLSAGQYETNIHKPLWDRSTSTHDIIGLTPAVPVPAFEFGMHPQVPIEEYYWLNYPEDDPYYYTADGDSTIIERATYLRCDPGNVEENTLHADYLDGSTYENFIHFELDEFPTVFDGRFDWDDLIGPERPPTIETFAVLMEYYDPFYEAINQWFELLETRLDTIPPETVPNFSASQSAQNYPYAHWTPITDSDFVTYEILADTEPLNDNSPVVWDFHDDPELREMDYNGWTQVLNAPDGQPLYLAVRAVDYYGNRGEIGFASQVDGYTDDTPVGLTARTFDTYPYAAWPSWPAILVEDFTDLNTLAVEYRTNTGLEGVYAVTKAVWTTDNGSMFGAPIPIDAAALAVGDSVYWRATALDRSSTGNEETVPADGWYGFILTDDPANPYESDFEDDLGGLVAYGGGDWEWGDPGSGPMSAHSGENVWATELGGNYSNNTESILRLGGPNLAGYPPMMATWWQWYSFEAPLADPADADDGGLLELRQGNTILPARVIPAYNAMIVSNIDYEDSLVYSGNGTHWHAAAVDLCWAFGGGPDNAGFDLRFVAVSDGNTVRPGWYMDDLAVTANANIYRPFAFALVAPEDDAAANPFGPTEFTWNRCIDRDTYAVPEYTLMLALEGDTASVYTGIDTACVVQLDSLDIGTSDFAYIAWWVEANSQGDVVASCQTRELAVPAFNGISDDDHILPDKFALESAYPNPFNPSITLSYAVPNREVVELSVFNILGQRVQMIERRLREPGHYRVTWTANGLASGTYVVSMKAGESLIATRKVTLVK